MRAHDEKCGVAENFCVIYLILFHQFEIIAEKETHTNKNIFRFYLLSFNLIRSATFFSFYRRYFLATAILHLYNRTESGAIASHIQYIEYLLLSAVSMHLNMHKNRVANARFICIVHTIISF